MSEKPAAGPWTLHTSVTIPAGYYLCRDKGDPEPYVGLYRPGKGWYECPGMYRINPPHEWARLAREVIE